MGGVNTISPSAHPGTEVDPMVVLNVPVNEVAYRVIYDLITPGTELPSQGLSKVTFGTSSIIHVAGNARDGPGIGRPTEVLSPGPVCFAGDTVPGGPGAVSKVPLELLIVVQVGQADLPFNTCSFVWVPLVAPAKGTGDTLPTVEWGMPAVTNRVPPPIVPSLNTIIEGSRLVAPVPLCVVGPEVTGEVEAVLWLGDLGVPGTDRYRHLLHAPYPAKGASYFVSWVLGWSFIGLSVCPLIHYIPRSR